MQKSIHDYGVECGRLLFAGPRQELAPVLKEYIHRIRQEVGKPRPDLWKLGGWLVDLNWMLKDVYAADSELGQKLYDMMDWKDLDGESGQS